MRISNSKKEIRLYTKKINKTKDNICAKNKCLLVIHVFMYSYIRKTNCPNSTFVP